MERKGGKLLHPRAAAVASEAQELWPPVQHRQGAANGAAMA